MFYTCKKAREINKGKRVEREKKKRKSKEKERR